MDPTADGLAPTAMLCTHAVPWAVCCAVLCVGVGGAVVAEGSHHPPAVWPADQPHHHERCRDSGGNRGAAHTDR